VMPTKEIDLDYQVGSRPTYIPPTPPVVRF
jgi:hypothetical protein